MLKIVFFGKVLFVLYTLPVFSAASSFAYFLLLLLFADSLLRICFQDQA